MFMTINSTNPISLGGINSLNSTSSIQGEFGGKSAISLGEYYKGGSYVPAAVISPSGTIPASGSISMGLFRGATDTDVYPSRSGTYAQYGNVDLDLSVLTGSVFTHVLTRNYINSPTVGANQPKIFLTFWRDGSWSTSVNPALNGTAGSDQTNVDGIHVYTEVWGNWIEPNNYSYGPKHWFLITKTGSSGSGVDGGNLGGVWTNGGSNPTVWIQASGDVANSSYTTDWRVQISKFASGSPIEDSATFRLQVGNGSIAFAVVFNNNVPSMTQGQAITAFVPVSGGNGTLPYTWSQTGLPTGLNLNTSNGSISGTPTAAGTYSVTITVKDSNTPQASASYTFSATVINNNWAGVISSNQTNLNLRSWALSNGWDGNKIAAVTINSGVIIGSTSNTAYALTIDGSWPQGLTVTNRGTIIGRGGDGGKGSGLGGGGTGPEQGRAGGSAVNVTVPVTFNNSGIIAGAGGGGGGGNSGDGAPDFGTYGGGGGGGAGSSTGAGGPIDTTGEVPNADNGTVTNSTAGSAGTISAGGAGGSGGNSSGYGNDRWGWPGGTGGGLGTAGGNGGGGGTAGGAAGSALVGKSNVNSGGGFSGGSVYGAQI